MSSGLMCGVVRVKQIGFSLICYALFSKYIEIVRRRERYALFLLLLRVPT